jgi:hypothetical protein
MPRSSRQQHIVLKGLCINLSRQYRHTPNHPSSTSCRCLNVRTGSDDPYWWYRYVMWSEGKMAPWTI